MREFAQDLRQFDFMTLASRHVDGGRNDADDVLLFEHRFDAFLVPMGLPVDDERELELDRLAGRPERDAWR